MDNEQSEFHRHDLIIASLLSVVFIVIIIVIYFLFGRDGTIDEWAKNVYSQIVQ